MTCEALTCVTALAKMRRGWPVTQANVRHASALGGNKLNEKKATRIMCKPSSTRMMQGVSAGSCDMKVSRDNAGWDVGGMALAAGSYARILRLNNLLQ